MPGATTRSTAAPARLEPGEMAHPRRISPGRRSRSPNRKSPIVSELKSRRWPASASPHGERLDQAPERRARSPLQDGAPAAPSSSRVLERRSMTQRASFAPRTDRDDFRTAISDLHARPQRKSGAREPNSRAPSNNGSSMSNRERRPSDHNETSNVAAREAVGDVEHKVGRQTASTLSA